MAGLHVADAVASRVHFVVKVNRYGETEAGYLEHLKKTIFRHQGEAKVVGAAGLVEIAKDEVEQGAVVVGGIEAATRRQGHAVPA